MSTTIIVDHTTLTFGDTSGVLTRREVGGDDTLEGPSGAILYGDAWQITGHATGGNDVLRASGSGIGSSATAIGDAETITGHGTGGDDTLSASGTTAGGDHVYGDAREMGGHAAGGDDLLLSGRDQYGDALVVSGHVVCGADTLTGTSPFGPGSGSLHGDAATVSGAAQCGDDVLIASVLGDIMWGDAIEIGPHATTGADRFVFGHQSGQTKVMDFEPGKDRIELDGFGLTGFQDLDGHLVPTGQGVEISLAQGAFTVLLYGVAADQLHAGDFLFG